MSDFNNVIGKENKRQSIKILNASFIRDMCHDRKMKISEEAVKEIAKYTRNMVIQAIEDTREMGAIVILRRHIERIVE